MSLNDEPTQAPADQGAQLAAHIATALKDHPKAEVRVNPVIQPAIPPHIAGNLLEFLRRVESKGMEAIAWVEAYTYVQQFVPQPQMPGAPQK